MKRRQKRGGAGGSGGDTEVYVFIGGCKKGDDEKIYTQKRYPANLSIIATFT